MKKKNTRKIAASVLAAALVLQSTAVAAMPALALEAGPIAADTNDPETPPLPGLETTEPTQAATQAVDPTEPPAPTESKQDPTEAATEAPTQAATDAATEAPTQAATEAPSQEKDALTLTGGTAISPVLEQGAFLIVKGTVTSADSDITSVNVGVYDANGTKLSGGTAQPNAKTYDLNRLDRYVVFDKLAAGNYTYKVTASNATHTNFTLCEIKFTITGQEPAADTLTITGGTAIPAELKVGESVSVTGTVTSASSNITVISVGIYDGAGNKLSGGSATPNAKTYDLKALDSTVSFEKLPAGTYTYKVIATNSGNANFTIVNQTFKVVGQGSTADTLTISGGMTIPSTLAQGQAVNVTGTVTSGSSNITSVTVGVYDANGKLVTGKTVSPNSKTFDLRRVDNDVAFSKLAAGSYTYSVIASNAANSNYALVNQAFSVTAPSAQADTLAISGGTSVPDTLKVGQALNVVGTVTSASSNITSLTVGVYDTNGKLVTGKTVAPNAKSYNLKQLDSSVKFSELKAGSYIYAVIATNAGNTNYALVTKQFKVGDSQTPSTTNDALTISGGLDVPSNIAVGKALNVTGIVTSASSNITALTVGIYNMEGKFMTGRTIAPNAKSYDLKKLDSYVAFNKLPAGKYVYAVIATNAANSNYALVNKQFTVGGQDTPTPTTNDALTLTGGTVVPDTLPVGKALNVTGTVTSASSNITSLTVGVYDANGKFVTGKTVAPNAKSYDLKKVDYDVAFSRLAEGTYTYAVIATNAANSNFSLYTKKFTVGNGQTQPVTGDALTISGGLDVPSNISVGKALNVTGVVTSASSNITALTVGVYDANGKFVTGRTINPNAKSYDLKNLDAFVAFNKLAEGTYTYAVIASNAANSNYALVSKKFTVGNGQIPPATGDTLTISGGLSVPDTLEKGKTLNVSGTVTSAESNITAVTVGVYDILGNLMTGTENVAANAKTFDLKTLDSFVAFNKLDPGTYTYKVLATNAANANYLLVSKQFTITDGQQLPVSTDPLTITGGMQIPDALEKGKPLNVTGTVSSQNSNITFVSVGVYDANGRLVTGRENVAVNAKTYDLKALDAFVAFNKLGDGTYTYKVIASNAANTNYVVASKQFTVGNGQQQTPSANDPLTITGGTIVPDTMTPGRPLSITGTVTSANSNMTSLTVGVYDANGKFVTGRTINPNAKTYNLKNLDAYVEFNKLQAGTYTYAVIASNAGNTNFSLYTKKFTVGSQQNGADALTITGGTVVPDSIAKGKAVSIRGVVTSASSNITSLTAGVYDANGKFVTGRTINPNAKSYDLKNIDAYIAFNTLAEGTYTYAVIASNAANTNFALVNKQFTVGNGGQGGQTPQNAADALTITGGTSIPDTLAQGKALSIRGVVTSASSNITALTAGVYDANGKFVTGRTIAPNAKSFDLKRLDAYIAFNTLPAGKYVYAVIASNAGNTNYALVNKTFTVSANGGTVSDPLTITGGMTVPGTLSRGRGVAVRGTITSSSSNITEVTVGVYNASGAMVTGGNAKPGSKTYNISALDSAVRFDQLAAGTYYYKVIASNAVNSGYTLANQTFTVR